MLAIVKPLNKRADKDKKQEIQKTRDKKNQTITIQKNTKSKNPRQETHKRIQTKTIQKNTKKSNYNYTEEQKSQTRRDTIRLKLTQVVHKQESNEIKLYRRTQKPDQKR